MGLPLPLIGKREIENRKLTDISGSTPAVNGAEVDGDSVELRRWSSVAAVSATVTPRAWRRWIQWRWTWSLGLVRACHPRAVPLDVGISRGGNGEVVHRWDHRIWGEEEVASLCGLLLRLDFAGIRWWLLVRVDKVSGSDGGAPRRGTRRGRSWWNEGGDASCYGTVALGRKKEMVF